MSRPRRQAKDRVTTAIRFPTPILDRLHKEADARDLSVNWLVNRAVDEFLERLIPVEEVVLTRDPTVGVRDV